MAIGSDRIMGRAFAKSEHAPSRHRKCAHGSGKALTLATVLEPPRSLTMSQCGVARSSATVRRGGAFRASAPTWRRSVSPSALDRQGRCATSTIGTAERTSGRTTSAAESESTMGRSAIRAARRANVRPKESDGRFSTISRSKRQGGQGRVRVRVADRLAAQGREGLLIVLQGGAGGSDDHHGAAGGGGNAGRDLRMYR